MKIALVTDSTCDIPYEMARELRIYIVPNILVIGGQTILDDENFSRQEFYSRLPVMSPTPTTSTASSGTYSKLYENLLHGGFDQVLSVHCSRFLSGIFNAATLAARAFKEKVRVIDSQQVSLGLGFQVLEAVDSIAAGARIEAVITRLEQLRTKVRLVAMLDTLEYVRRSGRVSWARASLGSLLNLRPFVEVKDGIVRRLGETRTRRKGIARLHAMMQSLGPLKRLAVLHSNAENEARSLLESLSLSLPTEPLVVNVTTIIGAHVGPNGLGFVAVEG
jgi:DegV family protein with EDD domain